MHRWGLAVLVILSCSAAAKEQLYSPPRLDNGQPDMQGMWVASNATPLQRPPGFSTLVIDEAQAAKLLASFYARFEDRSDGRLDIVCAADLKTIAPKPRRAHQGWRYLEEDDAPADEDDGTGLGELPPKLYGRLAELALV